MLAQLLASHRDAKLHAACHDSVLSQVGWMR
jgi:hypothetical protein